MPSPWAAAVALLALLAFGVFVGTTLTPAQSSDASARVLLAGSPRSTTATDAASAAKPPSVPAESTEPGAETSTEANTPTPENTATTTTTTTAASTPSPAGGKTKGSPTAAGESSPPDGGRLPPVGHVFVIVLSGIGESEAFGAGSQAPYLSKTLRAQGELIENYHALDGSELANAIALISGQGPTSQTTEDCPLYTDLSPATAGKQGQTLGNGCVYPATTLTVADQLTSAGKTWRAYVEDIGNGGLAGEAQTCRHPAPGMADNAHTPASGDAYVTWRNPFVYFHSLTDLKACASNDVGLDRLAPDLRSAASTPSLAYIVPNRCHDGSPQPCAPGQPVGPAAADAFLSRIVPEIESSAAYKRDGLIAITSDQAPPEGGSDQPPGGGASGQAPPAGETSAGPAAGGKVGLLLISKYVKPASFNVTGEYSHLSLLRSIEDLFGLQPLGYAGEPGLLAFDNSVFNGSTKR